MSESKRKEILDQLSNGEITVLQAEEELNKLKREKRGFFQSLLDMDINIGFGGDRIILEEVHSGTLEEGPVELELGCVNGSIKVECWDSQEYSLTVTKKVRAANEQEAEEIASQYTFANIEGNKIKAGDQGLNLTRKISTSLHLMLPKGHEVQGTVKTANGSIRISDIIGQGLQTSSTNGSVHLQQVSGENIRVKTVNGSIKIAGATSAVEARTTNGSIGLESTQLSGNCSLNTVNGSVRASFPVCPNTALTVAASSVSGSISFNHPQIGVRKVRGLGPKQIEIHTDNWHQAEDKYEINLKTVNGSIGVSEN